MLMDVKQDEKKRSSTRCLTSINKLRGYGWRPLYCVIQRLPYYVFMMNVKHDKDTIFFLKQKKQGDNSTLFLHIFTNKFLNKCGAICYLAQIFRCLGRQGY